METINIMLDEKAIMPTRAHKTDAGLDLYTPEREVIFPGDYWKIGTGVHLEIPEGYAAFVKSKSGLMAQGILVDGTIDSGYTGEINVVIFNHSPIRKEFNRGDKIAQIVIQKVETPDLVLVSSFEETERGDKGFGSSGR